MSLELADPFVPSLNKVVKELRRQENSLHNCIHSIVSDTAFIRQISDLYPELPVFANLRCGKWYTPQPDGTCYFKSTDGHFGEWSFSTIRLNWHVALSAAQNSGCIVVDATRRGKTFPDALTKTIPIWAAVVNKAIRTHLNNDRLDITENIADSVADDGKDAGQEHASEDVCSSPTVSSKSKSQRLQLQAWDEAIHLPPWISSTEREQISQHLEEWARNLLQAGAAMDSLVAVLKKPLRPLWISQQSRIWLNEVPRKDELDFVPLILVSASMPNSRQRQSHYTANLDGDQAIGSAFDYIPGAGDDEESWAKGLTPELFWQHKQRLLDAGPTGVLAIVKELVICKMKSAAVGSDSYPQLGSNTEKDAQAIPLHQLPVLGCRTLASAQAGFQQNVPCFLRGCALALGNFDAASPPAVSCHVDAVLNVGLIEHPRTEDCLTAYLFLPIKSSKHERHALEDSLVHALAFICRHVAEDRKVLVHCDEGTDKSVCIVLAALLCCFSEPDSSGTCKLLRRCKDEWSCSAWRNANKSGLQDSNSTSLRSKSEPGNLAPQEVCKAKENRFIKYQEAQAEGSLSKAAMRQRLAFVSSCYHVARPSRGNLKQVFNFTRVFFASLKGTDDEISQDEASHNLKGLPDTVNLL